MNSFDDAVRTYFLAPDHAKVTATLEGEKSRRVGATTWTMDPGCVHIVVNWHDESGPQSCEARFTSMPELWEALGE